MNTDLSDNQVAAACFRGLFVSLSQGIILVDSAGIIRLANEKAEAMFGYAKGTLAGRYIGVLIPERLRGYHAEELKEYLKSPRSRPMGIGMDIRGRRCDGSEFPVEISLSHLRIGEQTGIVSLISDVSERVEMEANARETEKMSAISRLAGGVARELEQYLAVISSEVRQALDHCRQEGALRKLLEAVSASAGRADNLAQDLLTIGGTVAAEQQWFSLNERLNAIRVPLSGLLGERIRLELAPGEDVGEILADPRQVDRVIFTLVENARDAMPHGGVVTVATAAIEVGEGYADKPLPVNPGPHLLLTVTDTGVGMTPELQAHLFEPVFTDTVAGRCRGISLAAVYAIVKSFGGSIIVSSQVERGTTFQVLFPRIGVADQRPAGA